MSAHNKKKQSTSITAVEASTFIVRVLVSAYTILLFVLLPLCYRDNYYDIGDFKYELFSKLTLGLFALLVPALFFYFISNISTHTWKGTTVKQFFSSLSLLDRFVLLYLLACLISFALSDYNTWQFFGKDASNPAWFGYSGWFMGLKSQLMLMALYFLVSRFFMKGWKFDLLVCILGASSLVFLLGILHRFLVDPLGLYEGIDASYHILFLSTIGQATWYSSFLCTVFPIGLFLFWYCDKTWQRVVLGIYTAIGFASLVTQNSDSAYFALAAFLSVLFVFSFQSVKHLRRFLEVLLTASLSMRTIGILQLLFADRAVPLEKLSTFLSQNPIVWVFIFLTAILYFLLTFMDTKGSFSMNSVKWIQKLGLVFIIITLPLGILCIFLTTTGHAPAFFQNISYFIFNDEWGNGRGFTWKYSYSMFAEYPFSLKLFGIGSDCFASYTYVHHAADVSAKWGDSVLANAHNEWLNTLLTTGLFGLISYAGIFVSAFVSFVKKQKDSIYLLAAAGCIGSYFFHNMFCYQQVVCTPFIFIIIGLAEFIIREKKAI